MTPGRGQMPCWFSALPVQNCRVSGAWDNEGPLPTEVTPPVRRRDWVFTGVLAFLAIQFIAATAQLLQPVRPVRFGWQMYAGVSQPTAFEAVYTDRVQPLDLSAYLADLRAEVDVSVVPPAVCARDSSVIAVRFRVIPERTPREFQCRR